MSYYKEKRIRKLKKKRIWPSILGLFLIAIILETIVFAFLGLYVMDLIDRKLHDSYKSSYNIAELMFSDGLENFTAEDLEQYIYMDNKILAVSVVDSNNEVVWSNNNYKPDINDIRIYYDQLRIYGDNFELIIESDGHDIFEELIDEVALSDDVLACIGNDFITDGQRLLTERNVPIISSDIWMAIYYEDYYVLVLNEISVLNNDIYMVVITVVLMLILSLVFIIYYIASIVGIIHNQKRITKILYTDIVTGGYNWLYFTKKGDKLLKKNKGKYNYAMVAVRMEKYRSFCTCFGVKEGEELLENFYWSLKRIIKKKEFMAHHDEADFGILLTYLDEDELYSRINYIEQVLKNVVPNIKMYFKFGVCIADSNDRSVDSLYNNSITALDLLAEDSEQKITSYDVEMKKQQLWERKVENEMDKALVTRQFKLYLQPKYSTKEENLAGAEALVRWVHPEDGLIPPNKFIPIFERNGFILQLDDYMIEEVARQQSKWLGEGKELFPISVNVSRAHFTREDLAEHICEIVDRYNVPHKFIELELTESAFFDDKYVLIDTVKKLREYGFIVSMDDFGAGYSSLNSLKELSIDVLKIDADFFRGVDSVERGMLIVSEVIDLAKKLDMKIVAEGIESKEQVDFLTQQECDLIQGYYYAKPMSIDEFEEKYKEI